LAVSRTHRSQAGAVAARTLLSLFVIFGMAVFFLPTSPLGNTGAHAQTTASPTTSSPTINFLNPSSHSKVISDKQETGASGPSYHLVAWVRNVPTAPLVEFKYQVGTAQESTIGTATATPGSADTFEYNWNIPSNNPQTNNIPDGEITLKAILYSNNGATEVARDQETVTLNQTGDVSEGAPNEDPPSSEAAETVEITYPVNGGPVGFYNRQTVIDVIWSQTSTGTPASGSQQTPGADEISVFYTKTPPGIEPTWIACGTAEATNADAGDGVRCALTSNDQATQVTGVAAVARDTETTQTGPVPSPADETETVNESGDAHRALPYTQVATTVAFTTGSGQQVSAGTGGDFPCSNVITTVVRDQAAHKIAGHNVDVHATGPTDQLQFDSSTQSDPQQNPESNHSGSESAYSCADGTQSGFQGQHEVANSPDPKHEESAAQGTSDSGTFKFKLHTDAGGTTQFTAFADIDNNDLRCSSEPSSAGSVGWNQPAPTPTSASPDQTSCPAPSASPSSSTTTSASPSGSSTSTASPSSSPGTSRTTGLGASDNEVDAGTTITLSGQVISSNTSCEDNEFVRIRRRVHGTDTFENFRSVTTDAEGKFESSFEATNSADYQAFAPSHDTCADSTSEPVTVLARVTVSITVDEFRPKRGSTVHFSGKVEPNHDGTRVVLQRKKNGSWVKVKRDTLDAQSRYSFAIVADWRRDRLFRVKWIQGDSDHEEGRSQKVKVTTHR
jgi:hypothetical protein